MRFLAALAFVCVPYVRVQSLAEEHFAVVPLALVHFSGAPLDSVLEGNPRLDETRFFAAYAVLDGPGEAFVDYGDVAQRGWSPRQPRQIAARVEKAGTVTGRLFIARRDFDGFEVRRFSIATSSHPLARTEFYEVMERHYQRLVDQQLPGDAWFRHQVAVARAERGVAPAAASVPLVRPVARRSQGDDAFDLFSGGLAVSENLDLDHALTGVVPGMAGIDVATLRGVSTPAMDWKPLVENIAPELDPLARWIPGDQHALFLPSVAALERTLDELESETTVARQWIDLGVDVRHLRARYGEQLCLPLSDLESWSVAESIRSLAITGSDPFLPSGSDVAFLFECAEATAVAKWLAGRHEEALMHGATAFTGATGSLRWTGVRSADRRISSIVCASGGTLIVTNSPAQLERLAATQDGRTQALADAGEYRWFRDRYRRGDACETAFLVLSDAAIRAWSSPRVRIAESRRMRAAAALGMAETSQIDALLGRSSAEGSSARIADLPGSSEFRWGARGIVSPTWGTLEFLTPIAELDVGLVSASEASAYEQFRRGCESRWRNFFDPIALRLSIDDATLGADLTVRPLVVGSEYTWLRDLTQGVKLKATAGDPHSGTLFHFALAFGARSPEAQWPGDTSLDWIEDIALYAERDPAWSDLQRTTDPIELLLAGVQAPPLALHIGVNNDEGCAAFVARLVALLDQSVLLCREARHWKDQEYTYLSFSGDTLYYSVWPGTLLIATREDVIQRAIDRRLDRPATEVGWPAASAGARIEGDALEILEVLLNAGSRQQPAQRRDAWRLLPILNEWKQRFPAEDPLALHARFGGERPDPALHDAYAWNEAWQSMQSTTFGCPAAPRTAPVNTKRPKPFDRAQFNLDFEGEGLRVRAVIERRR